LDEKGNLAGFNAKTSELLLTADNNYGVFDETPYNQKLKEVIYEGGFTITQTAATRYTARRFIKRNSYGRQIFLIKKRREVHPDLKEKALALVTDSKVKTDQVIGIQWRGDDIRETWKSPRFPRDIIDFGCTRINNTETMVIMTRNQNKRYALELLH
jgi:phage terminase large subunit-like protein